MSRRNRFVFFFGIVLLLTSLLSPDQAAQAQSNAASWTQVAGVPASVTLHAVSMVDTNIAWAVGEEGAAGVVYRLAWSGGRWNVEHAASFSAPLRAVVAFADNDIWAVGDNGLIVHRDKVTSRWRVIPSPLPGVSLRTLQMFGNGAEGWAAGSLPPADGSGETVLLHYQGDRWVRDTSVSSRHISSLHFAGGSGWAVGHGVTPPGPGIWRYGDGRWLQETLERPCGGATGQGGCSISLNAVRAIDADEAWVVGTFHANCSACNTVPYALHRKGGTWQIVTLPEVFENPGPAFSAGLFGLDFNDRDHGLAVGRRSQGSLEAGPLVLRYANGTWSYEPVQTRPGEQSAVDLHDATHALAVGSNGLILSYGYGSQSTEAAPPTGDGTVADPAFRGVWARTDQPLAARAPGLQARSWIWGPAPLTGSHRERYAETPGGTRLVQYFDKSRMEITRPDAPRNQWYVTNGLLVVEMIDGRLQVGDNAFEARAPADQAVAGDPVEINPNAPTYRSFRSVAFPANRQRAPQRRGQVVTTSLTRDGQTLEFGDRDLARYQVVLDAYDEVLGHNIPRVFTDFFRQRGVVFENGRYTQGAILDWLFVVGRPISEPYWARVKVAGVEKDVLMQAFERRVLTYTPDNPAEWRVEMGNVGQHYLRWRYAR